MKVNIITLFPEIFEKHLEYLPFKKAIELGRLEVNLVNLRDFALDSYGTVDGKPYGGGVGMVLRIEPLHRALESLKLSKNNRTLVMDPKGNKYDQNKAQEYLKMDEITIICGRYEGIDARISHFCDEKISVGDYVLSGGELPALVVLESVTRLMPGVLDDEATAIESFSDGRSLEFPQYTRPEEYEGLKVPEVLLSGNHKEIEKWRKENSKKA